MSSESSYQSGRVGHWLVETNPIWHYWTIDMIPIPQLDPSSEEPLYKQLHGFLKDAIVSGRLARGERIPPTRELAGQLGLNRATVSAAYELLEAEGLLRGHVGRGSYVEGPAAQETGLKWEEMLAPLKEPAPSAPGPDGISFATARPSEQLFPLEEFRATVMEVVESREAAGILQLGSPHGYGPLRRHLRERAQGARESDEVLVTNGCQQALDLITRTLVSAGDTVLLEDPVYPGLSNVFQRAGVRTVGVPIGFDGLDMEAMARLMGRERARLVVVTPNFQNPTGLTMPLSARESLLKWARDARVMVVENDIYGDLRYAGEALPTLKELDGTGDVVQLKSFSKIAFPGLRVGWVLGPRAVLARLAEAKQWSDLHTDQLAQAVLLRFAESGRLGAHRRRIVEAGGERLRTVLAACEKHLPAGARFTRPQGGMSLWVRLPEPLDASALLERAVRAGVSYLPGRTFAVTRPEPGGLRLSFAGLAPEKIRAGLGLLGEVFRSEWDRAGRERRGEPATAIV
jgi:2-aminoadipate transaminase